jgi:hypothetical protein
MRTSAIVISGLAAVASATTTSTWGYSTTTSSSSSYDPTWSTSSTTTKAAVSTSSSYDPWSAWTSSSTTKAAVSTSSSYDPSWSAWTSSSTTKAAASASYDPTWSVWTSTTKAAVSTSYDPTWSAWGSGSTAAAAATTPCPVWTGGTAPPAYYTNLPASIKSALPSWTGAPPSDYCYYTSWMQSFSSCTAPAVVSPTTFASTGSYDPTWSAWSSAVKNTNLLLTAAKATGTTPAYGTWNSTTG